MEDSLTIRLDEPTKLELEGLAIDRSEPGDRVSMADIAREAIEEKVDRETTDDDAHASEQPAD